jgi:hypothetical protein
MESTSINSSPTYLLNSHMSSDTISTSGVIDSDESSPLLTCYRCFRRQAQPDHFELAAWIIHTSESQKLEYRKECGGNLGHQAGDETGCTHAYAASISQCAITRRGLLHPSTQCSISLPRLSKLLTHIVNNIPWTGE